MQRREATERGGNELGVQRILRVRLVDTVASQVRNMILAGKLAPGTRLRQVDLSSRLGISRTPLREALMKLEQEGLITVLPRGGLRVLELDAAGAVELYELREVLDGLAARLAAQRVDRAGLRALARHLRGMEAAVPRHNAHAWFVHHAAFHEQIFRSSGNGRALAMISHVRLSIQRFHQLLLKTPNRLQVALQEHREIFRAIEAGRADAAETVARRHIKNAREIVLQLLREQDAAAQGG